ncbi:MAG: helix-turn-helix transcriptional regulator [Clostridia bacterium]|nr:helix-turn-helix transcriptional regulator [Clostridia bacterium]
MLNVRIKELRTAHNLTQVEFANKLSVAKQTVSNWENNNIQPSIDMLIKIADYFGVTTDYLLGRNNDNSLDISTLTAEQAAHIRMIIADISNKV